MKFRVKRELTLAGCVVYIVQKRGFLGFWFRAECYRDPFHGACTIRHTTLTDAEASLNRIRSSHAEMTLGTVDHY